MNTVQISHDIRCSILIVYCNTMQNLPGQILGSNPVNQSEVRGRDNHSLSPLLLGAVQYESMINRKNNQI